MYSEPSLEDTESVGSAVEQVIRKQEKGVNYQEPVREDSVDKGRSQKIKMEI